MQGVPKITLEEMTRRLAANPLLAAVEVARTGGPGGSLIRDVLITNTPTRVQHPLRGIPRGYIITYRDKNSVVFAPPGNPWGVDYIILQSSVANTTIRLFVY